MTASTLSEHGHRPAVIYWIDTTSTNGWQEVADLDGETCIVVSVGMVLPLGTRDGHLSICQDVHPDGQVNGVTHIPLPMLRRIDYLDSPPT